MTPPPPPQLSQLPSYKHGSVITGKADIGFIIRKQELAYHCRFEIDLYELPEKKSMRLNPTISLVHSYDRM